MFKKRMSKRALNILQDLKLQVRATMDGELRNELIEVRTQMA